MSAPRPAASATSGAISATFSDLSARAENWTHAARIVAHVGKPTGRRGASSSSSHCMNAIEHAAKRMTACSIAIPIAPIC